MTEEGTCPRGLTPSKEGGKAMLPRKVEISGVNTYKLPTLTNKEIQELFTRLQEGEESAREELVNGNLRLVLSVLKKFNRRGEQVDDLFQVGCIGLMKAIDNFDRGHGVQFSTYAVPMIIGEIRRYLRDNTSVRVSRSLKVLSQKIMQTREKLIKKNQVEPTVGEIARELGITREEVVLAFNANSDPVSLNEPLFHDSSDPLCAMDMIKDQKQDSNLWVEDLAIEEAMAKLPPREIQIMKMRFYQGKTQMEVAEEIGISQAQVSRIEKTALKFIRMHLQAEV